MNTQNENTKNCICYTRVASKEQTGSLFLKSQKKAIEKYALANNFKIVGYFECSNDPEANERKEFDKMLKAARADKEKISHLLIYAVDRLSRSGENVTYMATELKKANIQVVSITQPSDFAFFVASLLNENTEP